VTYVEASSPAKDAQYHNDEILGGLLLAASGGILIAFLQELLSDKG
jgi:hypothetical protein